MAGGRGGRAWGLGLGVDEIHLDGGQQPAGVLVYSADFYVDKQRLGQLIDLVSNITVGDAEARQAGPKRTRTSAPLIDPKFEEVIEGEEVERKEKIKTK